MKCLRHKIHLNLFLSVLTANLDWVLSYAVQVSPVTRDTLWHTVTHWYDLAGSQSLVLIPRQGYTWQPPPYLHPLVKTSLLTPPARHSNIAKNNLLVSWQKYLTMRIWKYFTSEWLYWNFFWKKLNVVNIGLIAVKLMVIIKILVDTDTFNIVWCFVHTA